jgi:hypothetical protein
MIKNYTSDVSADKSVLHIEKKLAMSKANKIMKIFDWFGNIEGIAFIISINGNDVLFRLPARIDRVEKVLMKKYKRPAKNTARIVKDQASKTAWKLLAEWVDIQLSLVELDQADLVEVFMPYIYDFNKNQSLFDKMKKSNFSLLEDKRS